MKFFQNFPLFFFNKKKSFLRFSYKKIHLTSIWNLTKFVRNVDFGSKTILQPFRVTNEDHFSYRDHNFLDKNLSCENRFSTTMKFSIFYCFYKEFLTEPSVRAISTKIDPKKFFFGFRFFLLSVFGVRTNITNRSGWTQKTSQIASMCIGTI